MNIVLYAMTYYSAAGKSETNREYITKMKTRTLLFTEPFTVVLGDTEIDPPGAGEVLIETAYSCISPGTEMRCFAGTQAGLPAWPFIPGYALTGHVIACGEGVTTPAVGTPVFCRGNLRASHARCWGGHIGHALAQANRVYPLPDGVDLQTASLGALAGITFHGLRLSRPQAWETVAVVGLGPIGHLAARMHALSGARVVGADTVPERANALRVAGIEAVCATPDQLTQAVRAVLPDGADIVVDATGVSAAAAGAVAMASDLPWDDRAPLALPLRYLVQGSYADTLTLPYDEAFRRELTVLFTRDCQPSDIRAVFDLMGRGKLSLSGILGEAHPPEAAPDVYGALQNRQPNLLTAAFRWR